jgi:hypothetical protein
MSSDDINDDFAAPGLAEGTQKALKYVGFLRSVLFNNTLSRPCWLIKMFSAPRKQAQAKLLPS